MIVFPHPTLFLVLLDSCFEFPLPSMSFLYPTLHSTTNNLADPGSAFNKPHVCSPVRLSKVPLLEKGGIMFQEKLEACEHQSQELPTKEYRNFSEIPVGLTSFGNICLEHFFPCNIRLCCVGKTIERAHIALFPRISVQLKGWRWRRYIILSLLALSTSWSVRSCRRQGHA